MSNLTTVLIMAGGTGGHIFPAQAVGSALLKDGYTVDWLGAENGMEARLVSRDLFNLHLLPVSALKGGNFLRKLLFPVNLLRSIFRAWRIFNRINPKLVLGFGGYASGPGGIVAKLKGVPLILHEQNAVPGFTNRNLSKTAALVLQAFPDSFPPEVGAITIGNPVRQDLVELGMLRSTPGQLKRLLILGGSLGAQSLNDVVPRVLSKLKSLTDFEVWHQTGQGKESQVSRFYSASNLEARVEPFITNMAEAYAWADLVICRSGASTVSELAVTGRPSILIPYPWHQDRQQYVNAHYLAKSGAAVVVDQTQDFETKLAQVLEQLSGSQNDLAYMSKQAYLLGFPESTRLIVDHVTQIISRSSEGEK